MSNWSFLTQEIKPTDFLIDCRNQTSFQEGTIKGAYYFPFVKRAYGSDTESTKKIFGNVQGVINLIEAQKKTRVVIFDEGMGMYASRMLYFLRAVGFQESYLFAQKWPIDVELVVETKNTLEFEPLSKFKPIPTVIDKAFIEKNLTRLQMFDTRTLEEYEGKLPRLVSPEAGSLCGRLPGAFLWDWCSLFNIEGILIDKAVFSRRLLSFPFMPERTTIVYDYNGARSCIVSLMLREVGYQEVYTYQGSWFEWRKSNLPKQAVSIYGGANQPNQPPRFGGILRKTKPTPVH